MIPEENRDLIEAGLQLLTPPGLKCTKEQINRAVRHLNQAIIALSAETRRAELNRRRLAKLKCGPVMNRINNRKAVAVRWDAYAKTCDQMSNAEFRELSMQWTAQELAELTGYSAPRIRAYRRMANPLRVPNDLADKLMELVRKSEAQDAANSLPGFEPPTDTSDR